MARPTKYKKVFASQAFKLTLLGITDMQLADLFEVNIDTIHEWKKVHKGFSDALRRGKTIADANVAHGLYKRAIGFEYDEVTFEKVDTKDILEVTTAGEITAEDSYKKKVVTKLVVPETGAAMSWLSNRQKDLWRNKQSIEHVHEVINKPTWLTEDLPGLPETSGLPELP